MRMLTGGFVVLASLIAYVPFASAQKPSAHKKSSADTAVGGQTIRLYLSPIRVDSGYRLAPNGYSGATHVEQNVNFAERPDSPRVAAVIGTPTRAIDTWNGVQFVSPALAGPFRLSGSFSGRLELITNKPDFDFQISLYELTSGGDYILASSYSTQETAVGEASHSAAMQPGIRQYREYQSGRFASRTIQNGSRLVVLITILKSRDGAPNAGAVNAGPPSVSDATADGEPLLKVGWYGDSFIDLHVN